MVSQRNRMNKMKLIFMVVLQLLVVDTSYANRCSDLFQLSKKNTHLLKAAEEADISDTVKKMIRNHPIYKFASSVPDGGKKILFNIRGGPTRNFGIHRTKKGEGIQGIVVAKYLRYLFPQATVRAIFDDSTDFTATNSGKTQIDFYILDSAEYSSPIKFPKDIILEMPMLKAGNPTQVRLSSGAIRKILGIPAPQKVIHVYVKNEVFYKKYFDEIIKQIGEVYPYDMIILSFGNQHEPGSPFKARHVKKMSRTTEGMVSFDLSEVERGNLNTSSTKLVFNDTIGLVPSLHAAANLAIVIGPVNFIEPLGNKTRTLHVQTPNDFFTPYDSQTLLNLIRTAESTGGFVAAENTSSVKAATQKLVNLPEPIPPAFIEQNGKSPFELVLDRLFFVISEQMK